MTGDTPSRTASGMDRFLIPNARWLGAGFLMTFSSSFGQTYFIALSNPGIRQSFDLSHGQIGSLYGLATLGSAAILLELGKLADRFSARLCSLGVGLGLALACALMALATGPAMVFVAFLGLRLFGQGMFSHVAMTATGRWFDAKRGRAVAVVGLGYPVGEMVLPIAVVALMAALGWQTVWWLAALFLMLITIPSIAGLLSRERSPKRSSHDGAAEGEGLSSNGWRRSDVIREWSFWLLLLGVLCPGFMVTGLFFHQGHLIELKAWSPQAFATGIALFAATAIPSGLLAGALADRFSARALLPVYLLPMALGLVLLSLLSVESGALLALVLVGVTAGSGATIMGALWPELYGTRFLGEIRAMAFSTMVVATAASPFLLGALIDQGVPYTLQLFGLGAFAIIASGLMLLLQPRLAMIAKTLGD